MVKKHRTLVDFKDVSLRYGVFDVLKNVTASVVSGDRIALVGPNGAGKSTLLQYVKSLAASSSIAVSGSITVSVSLSTTTNDSENTAVELDLISGKAEVAKDVIVKYVPQLTADDARLQKYADETGKVTLSGGEKTKKLLADIFAGSDQEGQSERTLYLLDEPTNNLDSEGLAWLSHEINSLSKKSAVIIVSHDRAFLDNTATKIFEIDEYSRSLTAYECTYSEYREIKKKVVEDQWKDFDAKQEEVKRLKKDTERKAEWQHKIERERANNKNLAMHEKEKPVAAYLRDKEGKMGKRTKVAKDRAERFDKETEVEKPNTRLPIRLEFDKAGRSGEKVFVVNGAVFTKGEVTANSIGSSPSNTLQIGPIHFEAKYGEKIHVLGKNGSGKTTLIHGLLGEEKTTSGEIIKGTGVKIGYLPQEETLLLYGNHEDIIDVVCHVMDTVRNNETEGLFRMTLKRFGFDDPDARKHISDLSAGERSRLQLALMYMMQPNCIILDEPTNHLDIEAVEALEKALKEYEGTLIIASHDQRFIDAIGITRIFKLD